MALPATCNRVVFIRTLIPSKKQGIEVLYSTYYIWIQYTIDCINPFSTFSLFILHLNEKFQYICSANPTQVFFLLFQFQFLYFFHRILLLTFILTILYRTNIIHRDKQFYLFPSHRFSFLPVDSNDGFLGLALLLEFLIEKVDNIEIGDGPAFFTFISFFDR